MQKLRTSLVSFRDLVVTGGPFIVLVLALIALAYWMVRPQPPHTLVMATGPANSDYDKFGQQYQSFLAKHGIKVQLRQSEGSRKNFEELTRDGGDVMVGIVREGTADVTEVSDEVASTSLVSLGRLFYEPIWLFHRDSLKIDSLVDLRDRNINIGPLGGGTSKLIGSLLAQNQMTLTDMKMQRLDHTEAVIALLDGKLDGVFFTSSSEGLLIQMLLKTPGVKLFNFNQAEAYSRRLRSLTHVVLPRGVVDLAADMPKEDVHLLAPNSTLLARSEIHPALVQLLVQAAAQIHGGADWFGKLHEFPSSVTNEFVLADEAKRFYRSGPPFLQRYLPFWVANVIDRMWVVVISLAALLIPLSKILPPLYQWRIRKRIYRWYAQLRDVEIEAQTISGNMPDKASPLIARLNEIETHVNDITVPLSYADEVYFLRQHIDMVRSKLVNGSMASFDGSAMRLAD
jgi:uncharacterized protein